MNKIEIEILYHKIKIDTMIDAKKKNKRNGTKLLLLFITLLPC